MDKEYAKEVASRIIEQLKQGTAPWQKPWQPGELRLPYNAATGKPYRGMNSMWLHMQGYSDPRWMTYKQAQDMGAQVRKGSKGTHIVYWKFHDEKPMLDENGKPVLDEDGNPRTVRVELERPRVFRAVVFNAQQIDGLPPLEAKPMGPEPERHARAEAILANSGAKIQHVEGDQAFYSPSTDTITLPIRNQFTSADGYYATALHELGHWTGHESRLNRNIANPFGSEAYAREELRAEIASLMLGERLEIGHDPGQHAAYVASWIKVLEEDSREIFRAAADAEKITDFVLAFEQVRERDQSLYAVFDQDQGKLLNVHAGLHSARVQAAALDDAHATTDRFAVYERSPDHDRRFARGDDFAGDAWRHCGTGEIRWTVVGWKGAGYAKEEPEPEQPSTRIELGDRIRFTPNEDRPSLMTVEGVVVDIAGTQAGNIRYRVRTDDIAPQDGQPQEWLVYSDHGRIEPLPSRDLEVNQRPPAVFHEPPESDVGLPAHDDNAAQWVLAHLDNGTLGGALNGAQRDQIDRVADLLDAMLPLNNQNEFWRRHELPHDVDALDRKIAQARDALEELSNPIEIDDIAATHGIIVAEIERAMDATDRWEDTAAGAEARGFGRGAIAALESKEYAEARQNLAAAVALEKQYSGIAFPTFEGAAGVLESELARFVEPQPDPEPTPPTFATLQDFIDTRGDRAAALAAAVEAHASLSQDVSIELSAGRLSPEDAERVLTAAEQAITKAHAPIAWESDPTIPADVREDIRTLTELERRVLDVQIKANDAEGELANRAHAEFEAVSRQAIAWVKEKGVILDRNSPIAAIQHALDFRQPHEMSLRDFVAQATVEKTDNQWLVKLGDRYSGVSDASTSKAALADVYRTAVHNAATAADNAYSRELIRAYGREMAGSARYYTNHNDPAVESARKTFQTLSEALRTAVTDTREFLAADDRTKGASMDIRDSSHWKPARELQPGDVIVETIPGHAAFTSRVNDVRVTSDKVQVTANHGMVRHSFRPDENVRVSPELSRTRDHQQATRDQGQARKPTPGTPPRTAGRQARSDRIYLAVPYREKDQAKARGAQWDRQAKMWYAPPGVDLEKSGLARWRADSKRVVAPIAKTPEEQFKDALQAAGLQIEGLPVMDGKIHRVPVHGDRAGQTSGAYAGHLTGALPGGFIQNHRTGERVNWRYDGKVDAASAADRERLAREAQEHTERRAAAVAAQHDAMSKVATALWKEAPPATANHPYCVEKGITNPVGARVVPADVSDEAKAAGVRIAQNFRQAKAMREAEPDARVFVKGDLLVPAMDADGKVWSVQSINPHMKALMKGGRKAGCLAVAGAETLKDFHSALDKDPAMPVVIAEGYATADTVSRLLGRPVVVSFDSGNLNAVAEHLRNRYPDRPLFLAADNDHRAEREIRQDGKPGVNVGLQKAREAASNHKGAVLVPPFRERDRGSDWNDYARQHGDDAARKELQKQVAQAKAEVAMNAERLMTLGREREAEARNDPTTSADDVFVAQERSSAHALIARAVAGSTHARAEATEALAGNAMGKPRPMAAVRSTLDRTAARQQDQIKEQRITVLDGHNVSSESERGVAQQKADKARSNPRPQRPPRGFAPEL